MEGIFGENESGMMHCKITKNQKKLAG